MKEELLEIISKEFGNYASTGAGILLIIISISYISAILTSVIDSENNNIVSFACVCLICVPIIQNVLLMVLHLLIMIGIKHMKCLEEFVLVLLNH